MNQRKVMTTPWSLHTTWLPLLYFSETYFMGAVVRRTWTCVRKTKYPLSHHKQHDLRIKY